MVIEVFPHERDNFNDLARLTIRHTHGELTTPARMVNRYDLNAKTNIGTDIPLMKDSHAFMIQEKISPETLDSIMNRNGFLHKMRMTGLDVLSRIGDKNLRLFYPSLTRASWPKLYDYNDPQKKNLVRFLCNVAIEIGLESIVLPVIYKLPQLAKDVSEMGLQLIPSLEMVNETAHNFEERVNTCMEIGSRDIPLLAVQFATYAKANKAYDYLRERLDTLHEKHQGIMIVDADRAVRARAYKSVSAPHYGAFLTADLSVERYQSGGGGPSRNLRIFFRDSLSVPETKPEVPFDPDVEKTVFENDPHLQELFVRAATNKTTDADWNQGLPRPVIRIHEAVRSRTEFGNLSRSIRSNSARDYLQEKPTMNEVITKDLSL